MLPLSEFDNFNSSSLGFSSYVPVGGGRGHSILGALRTFSLEPFELISLTAHYLSGLEAFSMCLPTLMPSPPQFEFFQVGTLLFGLDIYAVCGP